MTRQSSAAIAMPVHDLHPEPDDLLAEVTEGLRSTPKSLPCKYFYDAEGSLLFDQICELDEYYPTRTEISILETQATAIAEAVGREALVIELGSGSSTKTHILLDSLVAPEGYLPIDISRDHLTEAAERIAARFPDLPVWPVCADFNEEIELPDHGLASHSPLLFFPGSTIGNFDRPSRRALMRRMASLCKRQNRSKGSLASEGGRLLIGIDLVKSRSRLENAYNDATGVTAAFNLNLLSRINRELGANFDLEDYAHQATYNAEESRIEMHLESKKDQRVEIGGDQFLVSAGERICTEHSYKFRIDEFAEMAKDAGWLLEASWTDPDALFSVLLLRTA